MTTLYEKKSNKIEIILDHILFGNIHKETIPEELMDMWEESVKRGDIEAEVRVEIAAYLRRVL